MTTFEELGVTPIISRALKELGFQEPFPVQTQCIPLMLRGRDVVGQARTGTGKTAAFGIPILQTVDPMARRPQALIMVPTRELAMQVSSEISRCGKYTGVRTQTVVGGMSMVNQVRGLTQGAQIVVGTPGRVIDHIHRRTLHLDNIRVVVLDEADRMLDMGFIDDITYILELTPSQRQTALFSATIPFEVMQLAEGYMQNPERVFVSRDEIAVTEIEQVVYIVDEEYKYEALRSLIDQERISRGIVFCATKRKADWLSRRLFRDGYRADSLHGDLSQARRNEALESFRQGRTELLIATDVAARGLDIADVSHIVNFDLPNEPLQYFHRIGRTGRVGKSGLARSFATPMQYAELRRIKNLTHTRILVRGFVPGKTGAEAANTAVSL